MTQETATTPSRRQERTIILAVDQDQYGKIVTNPAKFRAWIDQHYQLHPELFPETFENGYKPKTVNTEGFAATMGAWLALFPTVTIMRCFLHAWLRIRERGKKLENFFELGGEVWDVCYFGTKRIMGQRIRRLREWAMKNLSDVVQEKTLDLCDHQMEWDLWYKKDCENACRPSNELDRSMRSQDRYFERGQHFHGTLESANLRSRAWAILFNYWDWGRKTKEKNAGFRCPAERLNGKRYADNWLENLLAATSAVPKTKKPPLKTA